LGLGFRFFLCHIRDDRDKNCNCKIAIRKDALFLMGYWEPTDMGGRKKNRTGKTKDL
jgi:hypothetical protein